MFLANLQSHPFYHFGREHIFLIIAIHSKDGSSRSQLQTFRHSLEVNKSDTVAALLATKAAQNMLTETRVEVLLAYTGMEFPIHKYSYHLKITNNVYNL